jgi:hypothetical protein
MKLSWWKLSSAEERIANWIYGAFIVLAVAAIVLAEPGMPERTRLPHDSSPWIVDHLYRAPWVILWGAAPFVLIGLRRVGHRLIGLPAKQRGQRSGSVPNGE